MPFTEKELQNAVGQTLINFWSLQKQFEELQIENQALKEQIALLLKAETPEVTESK